MSRHIRFTVTGTTRTADSVVASWTPFPLLQRELAQSHFTPSRARKRAFTRDFVHKSRPVRECPVHSIHFAAPLRPAASSWGFSLAVTMDSGKTKWEAKSLWKSAFSMSEQGLMNKIIMYINHVCEENRPRF